VRRLLLTAAISFAAMSAVLFAADPPTEVVEIPSPMPSAWKDIRTVSGKLVKVKTKDDKSARWLLIDDTNADLDVAADGKSASFVARESGTYRALVIPEKGDPGRLRFIVDGGTPDPAGPASRLDLDPDRSRTRRPARSAPSSRSSSSRTRAKPGTFRGDVLGSRKVQGTYKTLGLTHRLIDADADAGHARRPSARSIRRRRRPAGSSRRCSSRSTARSPPAR
jgi:hypothetical protein